MHLVREFLDLEQNKPIIVVHGGAWNIPDDEVQAHREGIEDALKAGGHLLEKGVNALEVAAFTVANMESSGVFDAGCGAVLNREGYVELDAGVMCGESKKWGAVAGIQHFQNPVQIARRLAITGDMQCCFLGATRGEEFARKHNFEEVPNAALICNREQERYDKLLLRANAFHTSHPFLPDSSDSPQGTVGCVVKDKKGRLAAATSTGGTPFSVAGRIGDSPLPGCGYFANDTGSASATGWGEAIASVVLCREAVCYLESGFNAIEAVEKALSTMYRSLENNEGVGATGGIILISKRGEAAWGFTTPRMARGQLLENGQCLIKVN